MADFLLGGILAAALGAALYRRVRAWREQRYCGCGCGNKQCRKNRKKD